jgi:hypothetical protein
VPFPARTVHGHVGRLQTRLSYQITKIWLHNERINMTLLMVNRCTSDFKLHDLTTNRAMLREKDTR